MNAKQIPPEVLAAYSLPKEEAVVETFGSGLIHHTWKVSSEEQCYILQEVNHQIFKDPFAIAANISHIGKHLAQNHPDYFFVSPLPTSDDQEMILVKGNYYRLFHYVKDSVVHQVVATPEQAFEAAVQFGRFTSMLANFEVRSLQTTLPAFHDLSLRHQQFIEAMKHGNPVRVVAAKNIIDFALAQWSMVDRFEKIILSPHFLKRVTHHDTKISNVLFNQMGKGLCVVDLDTVMPGFFFSDVGDMMRTYVCPVSEEETDTEKICIRKEVYQAIESGYMSEMGNLLTKNEKAHFYYSGTCMIYMQLLRFLTDHLCNDLYYGARYEGQNLNRAINQMVLLQRFRELETV